MKPTIGRIVFYHHAGSADGKFPPMVSPAIIQNVRSRVANPATGKVDVVDMGLRPHGDDYTVDLMVMSNSNGIFFAKDIKEGGGGQPSTWSWPPRFEE